MQSVLDQTTRTLAPVGGSRRYQISVENLRAGMFVVELDRPWLDTPFLLQGFLIDSQVELDTLKKYCEYVYVDLDLSSPNVAEAIRMAEVPPGESAQARLERKILGSAGSDVRIAASAAAGSRPPAVTDTAAGTNAGKSASTAHDSAAREASSIIARAAEASSPPKKKRKRYKQRADIEISQETRARFRQMVHQADPQEASLFGRMLGWVSDLLGHERVIEIPAASAAHSADLFPEGVKPREYRILAPLGEELPRARQAFEQGEGVLNTLVEDIRNGKTLHLEAVASAADSMVESMLSNPDALMWVARLREEDITTYNHGVKVALHLVALGRHLGFPRNELAWLGQIGMLADVGKTKLPRALLEKPGLLSPPEYDLVKEHVNLALHTLSSGPKLPGPVMLGIGQHHERMDGSGYPNGLSGNRISVYGRMAAIADCFAALITPRPYANAAAPQDALMSLYEWSGTLFHDAMVEQFVQAVGVFPVGSMVELSSGEIAVVIAHNRARRLEPRVLILSGSDKRPLPRPFERDLMREAKNLQPGEKPSRIARGLPAGAYGFKLRDYYLDEVAKQNGILS